MMEFVIMTLSFTVAILLASGIGVALALNPKVMKWYMKYAQKIANDYIEDLYEKED